MNIRDWQNALRISQWKKQILIWLPIIALGDSITLDNLFRLFWVSLAFSLLASCVYLYNDIQDLEEDKLDSYKKQRPLASGKISVSQIKVLAPILLILSVSLTFVASQETSRAIIFMLIFVYFSSNIMYSGLKLKKHRVIGLAIVASGFSIRFAIGTYTLDLDYSIWALVLIAQLSMFMLSGKRFQNVLRNREDSMVKNLDAELQFWLLSMVTFAAFFAATYSGFISDPSVIVIWGKQALIFSTLPLGIGLVRYVEIVTHPDKFRLSDATENMTKDPMLIMLVVLYMFALFVGRLTV